MNVYLYLLNTLADWEVGYLTAEINSKRFLDSSKKESLSLVKVGSSKEPVQTMGGMTITPESTIDEIEFKSGDLLILPGGDTWMEEGNRKMIELVPALLERGVIVAAICGATIALAGSGLLDERAHTSNDKDFLKMVCPNYGGSDHYRSEGAVSDNNLITASGLAPLEFSYEIFKATGLMKADTLEAWYQLNKTGEAQYFHALMASLQG